MKEKDQKDTDNIDNAPPPANLMYGLNASQVPMWLRNKHIVTGYRYGGTYGQCIKSLFKPNHNNFANAWTMILAFFGSIGILSYVVSTHSEAFDMSSGTPYYIAPFISWFLVSAVHLPFSVGYHIFECMSQDTLKKWRRLDVSFIFISSIFLTFALAFFALPTWATVLVTALAAIVTAAAIYKQDHLTAQEQLDQTFQTKYIATIVIIYLIPMVWKSFTDLMTYGTLTAPIIATITVFVSLTIGGYLYATGFPESRFPRTFDIWGNSHNLMHVCITVAHVAEFAFIYFLFLRTIKTK